MPKLRPVAPTALVLLGALVACDMGPTGLLDDQPTQSVGSAVPVYTFTDPVNDLRSGTTEEGAPDVTALRVTLQRDTIVFVLTFAAPIAPWSANAPNSIDGFIDLDLDENAATGIPGAINESGGTSDVGAEAFLALRDVLGGVAVSLMDGNTLQLRGAVPASFAGTTLTVRVPRALLNDPDGSFRVSGVVGHRANAATDFFPDQAHYRVGR